MENATTCYVIYEWDGEGLSSYSCSVYAIDINPRDGGSIHPSGDPIFKFHRYEYPACMGYGAIRNKIYFVGGVCADNSTREIPYSGDFYILDTLSCGIQKRKTGVAIEKISPIVVAVDGKLWVFPNNFGGHDVDTATIESYDPDQDHWETFSIFDQLRDDADFQNSLYPLLGAKDYDVLTHFVQGSEIYVILQAGTFTFDVKEEKLTRVGGHLGHPPSEYLPVLGNAVYIDGCTFCIHAMRKTVLGYKCHPVSSDKPSETSLPSAHKYTHAIITRIGNMEEKQLLVIRSGFKTKKWVYDIDNYVPSRRNAHFTLYLLSAEKEEPKRGPICRVKSSITCSLDMKSHFTGCIVACFPKESLVECHSADMSRSTGGMSFYREPLVECHSVDMSRSMKSSTYSSTSRKKSDVAQAYAPVSFMFDGGTV